MAFLVSFWNQNGKPVTNKDGPNHIRLPQYKCGVVYGPDIVPVATIGSDFVAKNMYGVISGSPHTYASDDGFAQNKCDINSIDARGERW